MEEKGQDKGDVWALLRRESVFELHAGDVVVERHRHDLRHGADQAVLLAAVLDHQRVRLVGVEHDVVGGHDQNAAHHSLQRPRNGIRWRREGRDNGASAPDLPCHR